MKKKPIILTDVDGVLVAWQSNLIFFAAEHNLPTEKIAEVLVTEEYVQPHELFNCSKAVGVEIMKMYNKSKWIRGLKPYTDALLQINSLKSKYDFVAVTALGKDFESSMNRMSNLNVLFPNAFKEVMICNHDESKIPLLKDAKARYGDKIMAFVDDRYDHCEDAEIVFGDFEDFTVYHMARTPIRLNNEYPRDRIKMVEDWNDIAEVL